MDEEELVCRPDLLACTPPEHHDPVEHAMHAIHGAEVVHGLEHGAHGLHHASTAPVTPPHAAPGSGGPHDPEFWMESRPATGRDLDEVMSALGEEAVREEATLAPTGPVREPVSEDMRIMMEDIARGSESPSRGTVAELMDRSMDAHVAERVPMGTTGFDPMHVPGPGERIRWPEMEGALDGVITRDTARVGEAWTRRGGPAGDYFAVGDPTTAERALAPRYTPWGTRAPEYIGTDASYTVTREFPVDRSVAAPAFAQPGGADQLRAAASAGALERGGYIELADRATTIEYANFDETAEIFSAVASSGDAEDLAALHAMHEANALEEVADAGAAAGGTGAASHVTPFGMGMGALGAGAGLYQMVEGAHEIYEGDYALGAIDGTAGAVGAGTGLAATGILGEAAATACAAPPVALAAGLASAVAVGEHYNEENRTFGEDEEGHGLSSIAFAGEMGQDWYDYVHEGIMGDSEEGSARDYLGWGLGSVAGVAGLATGGLIGLGGDLRYGVPEAIGGLYDAVTGYGDEYLSREDMWGEPVTDPETGETHHRTSREMIEDSAHGTFDTVHDGIMGLTGDTGVGGVVGEVLGTTAGVGAGALVGLGGGVVGGLAALGGTIDRGVEDLWSWMTD